MSPLKIGTFVLGLALIGVIGAFAMPLVFEPPEGSEGDPDPDSNLTPVAPTDGDDPPVDPTVPAEPPDDPPAASEYDTHLEVWGATGPLGPEPLPIDRRLFSTNVWLNNGWWSNRDPTWTVMLKAIQPGALRWPSGHPSQSYCFEGEPGKNFAGCDGWLLSKAQFDRFVEVCEEVGAEPFIGINLKKGSPEMAAAMVRYANVEKGYGIKYWHIGNEPDLGNSDENVQWTIEQWGRYTSAMRGVDDSIKIVGPELMTGTTAMGANNRNDWIRPFLEANPGDVDGVSWHLYPLDSENNFQGSPAYPTVRNLMQWWADAWQPSGIHFVDVVSEKLRKDVEELMPGAEIWVTELGPDSGAPGARGITDAQVAAVWFADVLGRFGEGGTDAVFQFAYDHWDEDDELSLVKRPPYGNYDPLPPWYTYWLYAEHWGDRMLKTSSTDDGNVSVHASMRPDGKLAVVLVNKAEVERTARLTLNEFGRVASADTYTISADSPNSLEANVNGKTVDPQNFEATTAAITPVEGPATTEGLWTLAPYTVTFVVFEPAA